MDIFFETQKGRPFSIEVGFFDTVLEIKEKIHKYQGIPIPKQTLVFHDKVLQDDRDVDSCEILHNSHIQLLVASEPDHMSHLTKIDDPTSPSKKLVHLNININLPSSKSRLRLQLDANDTVLRLKEKIHEAEAAVPVNRMVILSGGTELQDHRCLGECDNGEIDVSLKAPSTAVGGKRLKVMVLPKCGTKKIPVEVNASDNVGDLRKELAKLHQRLHFNLPQEGYFFIYKQNVMDDDRSFRWHHVSQGDTIEIFNGSVTGGS
ncbi:uncharacterized protein LOC110806737 [Carica papaya]|uniref:uncharacterized protein LOC110806737 n=1 Tax=Carica papaya TaxID=3649 RepID=UPI000B8CC2EE|nr:uncharacterized protein LOC110806737 [Carica papaya]